MTARRWLAVAAAAALLLLGGRALAVALLDLRWHEALGARELWEAKWATTLALRAGFGLAAGLFAFANLLAVRQSVVLVVLPRRVGNIEIGEEIPGPALVRAAAALAAVLGLLLALPAPDWQVAWMARFGRPFGELDPHFQRDLGFFVHWLPFEVALYQWAVVAVAAVVAVIVLLYALTPSLRWEHGRLYVSGYVRRHFTVLGAVLLLGLAWSSRLATYGLLLDGSGPSGAFVGFDHRVGIPGGLLLALLSLGAALVVAWAGFTGQARIAFVATTAVLVAAAARAIAPLVVRAADGDRRELAYEATRVGYTRRAFATDEIRRADGALTAAGGSAPAWDGGALAAALGATQDEASRRLIGWSAEGGRLLATVATPGDDVPGGWAPARALGGASDEAGDPRRVGDGASMPSAPLLVRPGDPGHVLVDDAAAQVEGVRVRSRAQRLLAAWALQDLGVAGAAAERGTLVVERDVRGRLRTLFPVLTLGRRAAPVVSGDSLHWVVDLLATSDAFPLAERMEADSVRARYVRRVGVAVVNAHTGRTRAVLDAPREPIAETWRRRFPGLFSREPVPASIAAALPPAEDELLLRASAFARRGSRLEGAPPRTLPVADGADTPLRADRTPLLLADGRLALVLPLLDGEDRVTGLVAAIGGRDRRIVWQPLATPGPRWPAAIERLRASNRALPPAQQPVVRGPARVITAPGGIEVAQSAYTWPDGRPPRLARVGVLQGGGALATLPPGHVRRGPVQDTARADTAARVRAWYDAMREALRRGDLRAFGSAFDSLGAALGRGTP